MASASSMHEAGHPKLVLWGNPEGRGGEGAASRVQGQGIHVYLRLIRDEGGQKTPQCCQVIVLQLNKFLRYLYMIWGVKQSDVVSGSAYMHIFIYPASLGLLVSVHAKLLQSCPTLCDPMDCSPPGSSVHWILQAWILEWVAMPSSKGNSQPRDRTCVTYVSSLQADSWPLVPPGKHPTPELYSVSCNNLYWKRIWKYIYMCIFIITKSLCYVTFLKLAQQTL